MNFLSLIEAKRDGHTLTPTQIREIVEACTRKQIPDYQMAAFLMATFFRGLDKVETTALTLAMRDSGEVLKLPQDSRPIVDKHSTGGVGDKVSLPLAPLLACLGFRVPMISGRGLGITGGTLDKLDSIPGFRTILPAGRIVSIVQEVGCVICGQTDTMVPADKALYALRDVTGTVPSIPLIVASILSKKLAESLNALVLDVKFGAAAFMPDLDQARTLARAMVDLGNECGVSTRALLTGMDHPLGRAAGNWLEIKESVECLEGKGPGDLAELVETCAAHLLTQTGRAASFEQALKTARRCLASGLPRKKWDQMLQAQGADLDEFTNKLEKNHTAKVVIEVLSPETGCISACDAKLIGEVIRDLGGGRVTKDSVIDYEVGMDFIAKPGERVEKSGLLARLHAHSKEDAAKVIKHVERAFRTSDAEPVTHPLVREVVER